MSFLGIEASLTGRRWIGPAPDQQRKAEALEQQTGLAAALCQILAKRDVDAADVDAFLSPTLKDLLPDPRSMKDVEKAAKRLLDAANSSQKIAIFADYDVDGGSSAALLVDWLRQLGQRATLYVPDRISEGYGPNIPAMTKLASSHDLIICVDCGTLSHEAIAAASGADVLVLDHHLGGETLPPALAVVNPNRQD
ncbi:MAG: DHH family phosphoesterase, partial [Paracoccaceae bacterium]|nr:DHH family phosphoesterase [Paracoccaceae bacterium]